MWKHSLDVRRDGNSPLLFGNGNFRSLWSSEFSVGGILRFFFFMPCFVEGRKRSQKV